MAITEGASLPTLEERHPLLAQTACHAFGPQAVMEILKLKVETINAGKFICRLDDYNKQICKL